MPYWFAKPHTLVLAQARIDLRSPRKRDRLGAKSEAAFDDHALALGSKGRKHCSGVSLYPGKVINICGVRGAPQQNSHSPAPPPCLSRAVSRDLIKASLSKGLVRRQIAPAFRTCARTVSPGKAVMKMNGTRCPRSSKMACSSTPLMPGIWTSAITHDVSCKWGDRKNSSADANVWAMYPSDVRRFSVATRTDPSSSTTEITGVLDTMVFLSRWNGQPTVSPPDRTMRREAGSENHT
jgi:hypothetical protein